VKSEVGPGFFRLGRQSDGKWLVTLDMDIRLEESECHVGCVDSEPFGQLAVTVLKTYYQNMAFSFVCDSVVTVVVNGLCLLGMTSP
jgi:hypothetical protein